MLFWLSTQLAQQKPMKIQILDLRFQGERKFRKTKQQPNPGAAANPTSSFNFLSPAFSNHLKAF
jgi:hypothetical protein